MTGIFTVVVSQAVLGQPVSLSAAWARVRPQIWKLLGLSVLVGICWVVASFACLLPGIWIYIALSVAAPALVLERSTVTGAMSRSWNLVKNNWWRLFGIELLARFITFVITGLITAAFTFLGIILGVGSVFSMSSIETSDTGSRIGQAVLSGIGGTIAGAITYPFMAAVVVLLYVDLRMRKEGLDIELMRASGVAVPAVSSYGGPPPGYPPAYPQPQYQPPQYQQPQYQAPQYPPPPYPTPQSQPPQYQAPQYQAPQYQQPQYQPPQYPPPAYPPPAYPPPAGEAYPTPPVQQPVAEPPVPQPDPQPPTGPPAPPPYGQPPA